MRTLLRVGFTLTLAAVLLTTSLLLAAPLPALAQGGMSITYGQVVEGEISNDTWEVLYTFEGAAGETIIAHMTALYPGLDSYLILRGPDGAEISRDDDTGGNLNSLLGPVVLAADGTYTLVATRFMQEQGGSSGIYQLVIERAEIVPLSVGETYSVELTDSAPSAFFSLPGGEAQTYSLVAQGLSGNAEFSVSVRDAMGGYVNQMYSQAGGTVVLDPLVLGTNGPYTIMVTRSSMGYDGAAPASGPSRIGLTVYAVTLEPIALDTPVAGELNASNPTDHYTFNGTAGQMLRLEGSNPPDAPGFEVTLYGPDSYAFNSGSTVYSMTPGRFALDPLVLPQTGQYTLVVTRSFDMMGTGGLMDSAYTIMLGMTQTPMLEAGVEVLVTLTAETMELVYRFEAGAGQSGRLTLRAIEAPYGLGVDVMVLDPAMTGGGAVPIDPMIFPEAAASSMMGGGGGYGSVPGGFVLSFNAGVPGTATFTCEMPVTGQYLVRVHPNNYYGGMPGEITTFGLMLEPAG